MKYLQSSHSHRVHRISSKSSRKIYRIKSTNNKLSKLTYNPIAIKQDAINLANYVHGNTRNADRAVHDWNARVTHKTRYGISDLTEKPDNPIRFYEPISTTESYKTREKVEKRIENYGGNALSELWIAEENSRSNYKDLDQISSYTLITKATRERFKILSIKWKTETSLLSNVTQKAMHPAYQQIIGIGKEAIILMLEDFCSGSYVDWFWALSAISGENPISKEQAGNIEAMASAWIKWGKEKGYLSDSTQKAKPNSLS
jgi:hypothetical protein